MKIYQENKTAVEFFNKLGSFSLGPIISALLGFIFVPVITRLVSPDVYGQVTMFTTATSLMGLIMFLGTDQAYVRNYSSTNDKNALWLNSFLLPFCFSIIFCGLALIFRDEVSQVLYDQHLLIPSILFAVIMPVIVLERYFLLSVRVHEVGKFYSTLTIIAKLITVLLTIFLVLIFGPKISGLLFPIIISSVILVSIIAFSKFSPKIDKWTVDKSLLIEQLKFGTPLVLSTSQFWILNSMDKLALRTWSSYSEIGIYAAGFSMVIPLLIVKNSFTTFWAPMQFRWREEGVSNIRFQKVTNIAALLLTLIFIIIVPLRWLIIHFLGPEYHEALNLVPLALIFPIMYTLSETTSMGISFSRKTYWDIFSTGIAALFNVLGNWLLVPKYGAIGAALSTGISYFLFFWSRSIISNRLWEGVSLKLHFFISLIIICINILAIIYSSWKVDLFASLIGIFLIGVVSKSIFKSLNIRF